MEYLKENAPALFLVVRYWFGPVIDAFLFVLGCGSIYCFCSSADPAGVGEFCGYWLGLAVMGYTFGLIVFYPLQEE